MDKNTFSQIKIQNFYKIFPNKISPKFTKCSQDGIFKGFPRIPSKSFPKLKFQNFTNVPNKFAHRNIFSKNTPNMAYKIFPTHLGRNIPNRISQLKFFVKIDNQIHQFQIFPTTNFSTKITSKFHKKFQTFPK